MDLKSPSVSFSIAKTSLAEAAAKSPASHGIALTLPTKADAARGYKGLLTNKTELPISFSAYMTSFKANQPNFKPPLSTTNGYQKWHPKYGWQSRGLGFCGTGLGTFTLEGGKSVAINLNTPYEGDGIYRFQLGYTAKLKGAGGAVYSKPFVISTFKGPFEKQVSAK